MVQFEAWLLKGLLGFLWVLPVWMNSMSPDFCKPLEAMRDQLNSSLRRRYLVSALNTSVHQLSVKQSPQRIGLPTLIENTAGLCRTLCSAQVETGMLNCLASEADLAAIFQNLVDRFCRRTKAVVAAQRQNLPINYTINVQYEEVFRLRNISRLLSDTDPAELQDLQELWITVTQRGINRILNVLPDRHPTRRKYLTGLKALIEDVDKHYQLQKNEEREQSASTEEILERLQENQKWKSVTPKSLLDNCYRTMHCLFKEDCFLKDGDHYDYCNVQHWRKVNGTLG